MKENTEQHDSFIMYTEQWPALSLLSDAQLAALMRAIFALHGAECSAPELDLPTRAVFLLMRPRFGANKARYEEKCRRNQENGRRGGRPRRAEAAEAAAFQEPEERAALRGSEERGDRRAGFPCSDPDTGADARCAVPVGPDRSPDAGLSEERGDRRAERWEKTDAKPKNRSVFSENRKTLTDPDPETGSDTEIQNHPLPSWEEGRGAARTASFSAMPSGPDAVARTDAAEDIPRVFSGTGGTEDLSRAFSGTGGAGGVARVFPRTDAAENPSRLPGRNAFAADSATADADPDPLADMSTGFHEFLAAYPAAHREPVGEAAQVWKKLARRRKLPGLPRLLQGLDAWEDSHQWRKDDGAYIPKAANFLRRSMWLSAPPRAAPDEFWDAGAAMARLRAAAGNPLGAGGRL